MPRKRQGKGYKRLVHFSQTAFKEAMNQASLSPGTVAVRLKVAVSSVHNWMSGNGRPTSDRCIALAKILGIRPAQLSNDFAVHGEKIKPIANGKHPAKEIVDRTGEDLARALGETTDTEEGAKLGRAIAVYNRMRKEVYR